MLTISYLKFIRKKMQNLTFVLSNNVTYICLTIRQLSRFSVVLGSKIETREQKVAH